MWQFLVGPLAETVNIVLKRVLPAEKISEAERLKIETEIQLQLAQLNWQEIQGQLQANVEEAKHENLFVSGWRPFIGWICGTAFALHFVVIPIALWGRAYMGWSLPAEVPEFDMNTLLTVLLGMLGLGGMRTFEKLKGVNKNR